MAHEEVHRSQHSNWLRASVLGANDGIVSIASLLLGVAASHAGRDELLVAGVAALVSGAMAMAAGEYVSVSSQADTERADLTMERQGLADDYAAEHDELAAIYVDRGLKPDLAREVARQLMEHDALSAHARDELGIIDMRMARPFQAAIASGASFVAGAAVPLLTAVAVKGEMVTYALAAVSLLLLALLGGLAARAGGASVAVGAARVLFWGVAAMILTSAIGTLVGHAL